MLPKPIRAVNAGTFRNFRLARRPLTLDNLRRFRNLGRPKGRSPMKGARCSLVFLGLLLAAAPAPAQTVIITTSGLYDGGGIRISHHHHHADLPIFLGGYGMQGYFVGPPVYGPVINQQVTIINYRPPIGPLPAPFINDDLTRAILPRPEPEIPLTPRPLPERRQPEAAPAPRLEQPNPPPAPKPPDLPPFPAPKPERRGENLRPLDQGKEAFADTDYGLAAQRFRQARDGQPRDATASFLLAQAQFALGKYQDAMDALDAGLDLDPNWPTTDFHPLDLYGIHVALYSEHLRRLDDAVTRFPNDPVVLFLNAYEMWFDGRRDEARALFVRARAAGADPVRVERFLRALPPGGV